MDPGRPSGSSPTRFLCTGFWSVQTIAVCISRDNRAVSSFGECGLSCGLRGALCTLQLGRSASFPAFTVATLGRSGWLGHTQQGLSPCKKRQASLGALTDSVLSLKPGSNQASERSPKERRGDKTGWTKPRSSTAVWTMGIVKARSSAERGAWLAIPR